MSNPLKLNTHSLLEVDLSLDTSFTISIRNQDGKVVMNKEQVISDGETMATILSALLSHNRAKLLEEAKYLRNLASKPTKFEEAS